MLSPSKGCVAGASGTRGLFADVHDLLSLSPCVRVCVASKCALPSSPSGLSASVGLSLRGREHNKMGGAAAFGGSHLLQHRHLGTVRAKQSHPPLRAQHHILLHMHPLALTMWMTPPCAGRIASMSFASAYLSPSVRADMCGTRMRDTPVELAILDMRGGMCHHITRRGQQLA